MFAINVLILNVFFTTVLADGYTEESVDTFKVHTQCDFADISSRSEHVDKTLMIRRVLSSQKILYITAPQGFGKSCNINMLKHFFELQTDEMGQPLTKANYTTKSIIDTSNYRLFADKELKITKMAKVMEDHFGKYPVLSLNFKCVKNFIDYHDVLKHVSEVIHEAFKEHQYLRNSTRLHNSERERCRKWSDENLYRNISDDDYGNDIKMLSKYLYKHHGAPCMILIDDFCSVGTCSLMNLNSSNLRNVATYTWEIVKNVLLDHSHYKQAVITGMYYKIPPIHFDLKVTPYIFWLHSTFSHFFGISEMDFHKLVKRKKLDGGLVPQVNTWYNGYLYHGKSICPIRPIMSVLKNRKIEAYWQENHLSKIIGLSLNYSIIRGELERLMFGERTKIALREGILEENFELFEKIIHYPSPDRAFVLTRMQLNPFLSTSDVDDYLYFLLSFGYLVAQISFKPVVKNTRRELYVAIPNKNVLSEFNYHWTNRLEGIWQLDLDLIGECAGYLNKLSFQDDDKNIKNLNKFHAVTRSLFKSLPIERIFAFDKGVIQSVLLYIGQHTRYTCRTKIELQENKFIDLLLYKGKRGIVVDVQFGMREKVGDGLFFLLRNKFLKALNGTTLFPRGIEEFLLLELRITEKRNTRTTVLINTLNMTEVKEF